VLLLVLLRSFIKFRILRGRKKKGTRGFIGLKDEVTDGFEKLSNLNIERERQKCLLDGLLSSYGMIRYAILEVSPMSLCSKKDAF
jgi:hypothetical protein